MADKEIKILEKINRTYKVEDGKIIPLRKKCPNCGRYMAEHKDRYSCGYCGYTIFKEERNEKYLPNWGIKV